MAEILNSEEMSTLVSFVEEAARSTKGGVKHFVESAPNTLSRTTNKRHHVVFGIRGSGKSSLLHKAAADLTVDRRPIAHVNIEAFRGHTYLDVLMTVLIATFSEFKKWMDLAAIHPSTRTSFWKKVSVIIITLAIFSPQQSISGTELMSASTTVTPIYMASKETSNYISDEFKAALANIQTVCLDISQVEQRGHFFENYNSVDFAAEALSANGIKVLAPGMSCDAKLVIQARFTGIKKSYKEQFGNGYKICYGGASSTGTWTLTITDKNLPPLKLDMDVTYDPPTIYHCDTKESDAPLNDAWIKAVVANLKRLGWNKMPSGWTIPK